MFSTLLPQVYERWWRPAWGRALKGVLGPGMADEKRIARLLMGLSPGDGVLDVACGTGNFTRDFAPVVGRDGLVVGLDASETMLAPGGRRLPRRRPRTGRLRARRRDRHAVQGPVLRRRLLLRGAQPVRRPRPPPSPTWRACWRRAERIALFTSAQFRTPGLRLWQTLATVPSGMKMFGQEEVTGALRTNGFEDVRVLISGTTQFVGGVLAS